MTRNEVMKSLYNMKYYNYTLEPDELFLILRSAVDLYFDTKTQSQTGNISIKETKRRAKP